MTGSVAKTGLAGAILALLAGLKELTPAKRETSERAGLLVERHGVSVLRCAY